MSAAHGMKSAFYIICDYFTTVFRGFVIVGSIFIVENVTQVKLLYVKILPRGSVCTVQLLPASQLSQEVLRLDLRGGALGALGA